MMNPQAKRLHASLAKEIGSDFADGLLAAHPLAKSPSHSNAQSWANDICTELEERLPPEKVLAVRKGCACGPAQEAMEKWKKLHDTSTSLSDFARRVREAGLGVGLETDGQDLLLSYPQCYCSFVKHSAETLPASWCACTLGYTERLFQHVLDRPVEASLLESIKTGGSCCVIRVKIV